MKKSKYFVSCPIGLEEVLGKELKSLGINEQRIVRGGIHFKDSLKKAFSVILQSRIASRVFSEIRSFEVKTEKDIYYKTKDINWSKEFDVYSTLKVVTTQSSSPKHKKHSKFKNILFISQTIKDAIVDRFKIEVKERPSVDIKTPDIIIHAHVEPNENIHSSKEIVTLLFDLTGTPLSNRGFREKSYVAPIRENIAAGILDLLEWDPEQENFCDVMCGSGTFLYEAYFKQYKVPPQFKKIKILSRNLKKEFWSFQKLFFYQKSKENQKMLKESIEELKARLAPSPGKIIIGFDSNINAVQDTLDVIEKHKLGPFIQVAKNDARTFHIRSEVKTLYFCNPPYGKRMGTTPKLEELYHQVGENFKQNYPGSRFGIISTNKDLLKKIALAPDFKHNLSNGPELLRIAEYKIKEPLQ